MPLKTFAIAVLVLLLIGGVVTYYYAGQEPGPLVKIEKPVAIGGAAAARVIEVRLRGPGGRGGDDGEFELRAAPARDRAAASNL